MSSFLPPFRRSSCAPLEDAPLHALPPSESAALSKLEALLSKELFSSSSPVLHHNDPWTHLPPTNRRALSLRFLRFHCLSVNAALAQMLRVAAWRRDDRPWERPVRTMMGPAAGITALRVGAVGDDGEALLYSPVKFYIKQDIDHAVQDVAIKTFFEQLLYAEGGPRCTAGVIVLDFQDMAMRNVDLVATKNGIHTFSEYYPEIFKKILVVNYAKWLYGTWKCVAPLLDARTVRKVVWMADANAMRQELAKYFAKGAIPRWLGGEGDDGPVELYTGTSFVAGEVARSMQSS